MSFIDQFKKGEISKSELRDMAAKDPALRSEIISLLEDELSEADLNGIAAAGTEYNRITGTGGNDTLNGTAGNDAMYGYGGDDNISGGSGDDGVFGGSGDDNLSGGSGDDHIKGDSGDDDMSGGRGNDFMEGGSGDDDMSGGRGNDVMAGGSGDDYIDGGRGNDVIMGGTGDDVLTGGQGEDAFLYRAGDGHDTITDYTPGEDKIYMGGIDAGSYDVNYDEESGNTVISFAGGSITLEGQELNPDDLVFMSAGTDGDDYMTGGVGHDMLAGGGGNDDIYGGDNSDLIAGGDGNDTMDGGYGDNANDIALGGEGNDMYVWAPTGDGSDTFDGGSGDDQLQLDMQADNVQAGIDSGELFIALVDGDGNSVELTSDMFDADGNLALPEGVSGTITGANGDVLTFTNVESIVPFTAPPLIGGDPSPVG